MRELSIEYVAGIIDGEGCINIYKESRQKRTYYNVRVQVGMADPLIPALLHKQFGGQLNIINYKKSNINARDNNLWCIKTKQAEIFLETVIDHLILKKEQAKLALELRSLIGNGSRNNHKKEEFADIKNRLSILNFRGKSLNKNFEIYN